MLAVATAIALGMGALAARLTQLQVVEASRYQLLSASNQFNFRLRPPPRGRIVDGALEFPDPEGIEPEPPETVVLAPLLSGVDV